MGRTHRTVVVHGRHQLDILGYNTRRKFGADNTVKSCNFDDGGFTWCLAALTRA
jgi:hypothetical protein